MSDLRQLEPLRTIESPSADQPGFRVGDWVEVRCKAEILKTLDKNGQLDGMPFMPEMFAYCGQRFQVYRRAHKTCDTAFEFKGRKMKNAVHLEGVRCSGQSHGGCEAACLIFWKAAWLQKPEETARRSSDGEEALGTPTSNATQCTEADLLAGALRSFNERGSSYVCQATQVPSATQPLQWWEWRQYIEDYTSGNVGLWRIAKSFALVAYRRGLVNLGIGIGPALKWLYDQIQSLCGGGPYPFRTGKVRVGVRTPALKLDLQPGEWVRVKSLKEIAATCDKTNKNRGLTFDPEMVPYCGGTYQVLKRVTKILDEKTGRVQEMKNPCIILDSVVCQARYCDNRLFCSRSVYLYWREIWLERTLPLQTSKISKSAN
jgi:hypothetical protein